MIFLLAICYTAPYSRGRGRFVIVQRVQCKYMEDSVFVMNFVKNLKHSASYRKKILATALMLLDLRSYSFVHPSSASQYMTGKKRGNRSFCIATLFNGV